MEARLWASGGVWLDAATAASTEHGATGPLQPRDWNMKAWRYVNLSKLIDFLEAGSLHSRAHTPGDPCAGSRTRLDVAAREEQFRSIAAELGTSKGLEMDKIRDHFKGITQQLREATHISC